MKALREWLIKQNWFIIQVDIDGERNCWSIWAMPPAGGVMAFTGTATHVSGWDNLSRLG